MSGFKFDIHSGARRDLDSAPRDVRERITKKLVEMASNEWRDLTDYDVKRLRGTQHDIYRTRIGGWRIVFIVDEGTKTVGIVGADKRSGAYGDTSVFNDRADEFSG